jgi:hypothetical protein
LNDRQFGEAIMKTFASRALNLVRWVLRELLGLFIDDEFLALAILGVVALAGALRWSDIAAPLIAGAILFFGCVCVLVASAVNEGKP